MACCEENFKIFIFNNLQRNLVKKVDNQSLEAFSNVDWVGDQVDRKSQSRYFKLYGGNIVSWKSKEHNTVSRSSTKAE